MIAAADYEGTIRAGTTVQRSAILDMTGPGRRSRASARYAHLVVSFRLAPGLGELDAHTRDSTGRIQSCPASGASDSKNSRAGSSLDASI